MIKIYNAAATKFKKISRRHFSENKMSLSINGADFESSQFVLHFFSGEWIAAGCNSPNFSMENVCASILLACFIMPKIS
jgi:hypothetical protein